MPAMARDDRIEINPKIMTGKPVIRGTRIPVELVQRKLAEGATTAELIEAYPSLDEAGIEAAKAWKAQG
jgi:uncharacterized protein (DUF433 family)